MGAQYVLWLCALTSPGSMTLTMSTTQGSSLHIWGCVDEVHLGPAALGKNHQRRSRHRLREEGDRDARIYAVRVRVCLPVLRKSY